MDNNPQFQILIFKTNDDKRYEVPHDITKMLDFQSDHISGTKNNIQSLIK